MFQLKIPSSNFCRSSMTQPVRAWILCCQFMQVGLNRLSRCCSCDQTSGRGRRGSTCHVSTLACITCFCEYTQWEGYLPHRRNWRLSVVLHGIPDLESASCRNSPQICSCLEIYIWFLHGSCLWIPWVSRKGSGYQKTWFQLWLTLISFTILFYLFF